MNFINALYLSSPLYPSFSQKKISHKSNSTFHFLYKFKVIFCIFFSSFRHSCPPPSTKNILLLLRIGHNREIYREMKMASIYCHHPSFYSSHETCITQYFMDIWKIVVDSFIDLFMEKFFTSFFFSCLFCVKNFLIGDGCK